MLTWRLHRQNDGSLAPSLIHKFPGGAPFATPYSISSSFPPYVSSPTSIDRNLASLSPFRR